MSWEDSESKTGQWRWSRCPSPQQSSTAMVHFRIGFQPSYWYTIVLFEHEVEMAAGLLPAPARG
jgi:hypothetical protein